VEFAAGQTVTTVSVTVNSDTAFEQDETVDVQFSGDSLTSDVTATGTIVNDDNVAPVAVDDSATTDEDTAVEVDVLSNDTDENGDSLSVSSASATNGSVVVNDDNTLTYTPNSDFNGDDTITYEVSDGNGGSDTGSVDVTVNPVNDAPEITSSSTVSVDENATAVATIDATDVDGDSITFSITGGADEALFGIDSDNGELTLNNAEDFEAPTNADNEYSVEVSAADGNGGSDSQTLTVSVDDVNEAPSASDDDVTVDEDTDANILRVLGNDTDPEGDDLTVSVDSNANNGNASVSNGNLTYTPDTDFVGSDSFTYEVTDEAGNTDTATVNVTVNDVTDTFRLTTNIDAGTDFNGTAGDDRFDASLDNGNQTLGANDELDGGDGEDRLTAQLEGAGTVTPTISNIESLRLTSEDNNGSTLDLTDSTGVDSITNTQSNNDLTVSGISSLDTELTIDTVNDQTTTFGFADVAGANDAATVTLDDVTGTSNVVMAGVETITINSVSSANTIQDVTDFGDVESLVINGEADFTVTDDIDDGVTSIDGSGATGDITLTSDEAADVTISGGGGADALTIADTAGDDDTVNGGAGNDTITFDADGLTDDDTVDGGAGTDTLAAASAGLTGLTSANSISNIEVINVTNALGGGLDVTTIDSDIERVDFNGAVGNTTTFGAGSNTVGFDVDIAGATTFSDTGDATDDELTIVNTAQADVFDAQDLTVNGFETLTVDTSTETVGNNSQDLGALNITPDGDADVTVNFEGNNTATVGVITATDAGTVTVDASGLTDDALFNNNGNTPVGVDAFVGSGNDDVIDTAATDTTVNAGAGDDDIDGGDGDDTLNGETGEDTIDGGAGDDAINGGADDDTLNGDAGDDTIDGGAGDDDIDGGANDDTLNGGAGDDTITATAGNDTVDGGADDDRVVFAGGLAFEDTAVGGEGTDTLSVNAGVTAAAGSRVSEFEVLELTNNAANQDLANFGNNSGFTTVNVAIAAFDNDITNARADVTTLGVGVDGTQDPTITSIGFSRISDTADDSLTLQSIFDENPDADTETVTVTTLTADNEEALTIAQGDASDGDNLTVTTLEADDLESLTIAGAADVEISNAITGADDTLTTIDASDATGTVDVDASNSTVDITVTAGSGATTIVTGSGDDTFTGGAGDDTFTGGQGADTVDGGAGTNTFSAVGMDVTNVEGSVFDSVGAVVNLSDDALTALDVNNAVSEFLSTNQTEVASNTATYLYDTDAEAGSDVVDSLSNIQNLTGSGGIDYLVGSDEANVIDGGAGADTLTGGAGADTFTYVAGADGTAAAVDTANGSDTIEDFATGEDVLGVDALLETTESFVAQDSADATAADNVVVVTDVQNDGGAGTAIDAAAVDALGAANSTLNEDGVLMFSNDGEVQLYYDTDIGNAGGAGEVTLIGTFTNLATADLANIDANNFA